MVRDGEYENGEDDGFTVPIEETCSGLPAYMVEFADNGALSLAFNT